MKKEAIAMVILSLFLLVCAEMQGGKNWVRTVEGEVWGISQPES